MQLKRWVMHNRIRVLKGVILMAVLFVLQQLWSHFYSIGQESSMGDIYIYSVLFIVSLYTIAFMVFAIFIYYMLKGEN